MIFTSKSNLIKSALNDWAERSIITPAMHEKLEADLEANTKSRSFSAILVMLAAICICFAAITFVASNWEEMPRLLKTSLLLGAMLAFWGTAIWCKIKSLSFYANAAVLVACGMFGASIMLIAQMYHIQGAAEDAVWLWAFGTLIAAGLTRSIAPLCLGIILLDIWIVMDLGSTRGVNVGDLKPYLTYALPALALAIWMQSKFALHLALIGLSAWLLIYSVFYIEDFASLLFGYTLFAFALGVIALSLAPRTVVSKFQGLLPILRIYAIWITGAALGAWYFIQAEAERYSLQTIEKGPDLEFITMVSKFHLLPIAMSVGIMIFTIYAWQKKWKNVYDIAVIAFIALGFTLLSPALYKVTFLSEAALLGTAIWIIRMGIRIVDRPVMISGFIAFAAVMLIIYGVTVGTLIGTAGFYALAGLTLLAIGLLAPRLMAKKEQSS